MKDLPQHKPVEQKHRISIVENVYYQKHGEQPIAISSVFTRWLTSDEQPYLRIMKLTGEWQLLDSGWIKSAGMLVVKNDSEGPLIIRFGEIEAIALLPQETCRFQPFDLSTVSLRGIGQCTINLFPK